ncbi:hypothetical protein SJI45_02955 [Streptomyces sp. S399]|uniref:hypothetical protein n=1 Tax=Streptomyces sp. S399 TaxID=3096009 RepID=UPI002A837FE7|nr:hypothetical protein [Streptomyces sp. S399]WPR50199.1 hypothetical protein SJI45_02955 [Streptomyces sp. S399]
MHRPRTAAALLATAAVTALAGCVTVDHPAPGPSSDRSPAATPAAPEERAEPQIVQPPPREALRRTGEEPPPGRPRRRAPVPRRRSPAPGPRLRPRTEAAGPGTRRAAPPRAGPGAADPPSHADVCALGRQYGEWAPGSTPARICDDTYGG